MSLFSFTGKSRFASKKTPCKGFKPALEGLEERKVMSASSVNLHAVTQNDGTSAVYFLKQDQTFNEHTSAGTYQIAGANTVKAFSAGLTRFGYADAFVLTNTGSVSETQPHIQIHDISAPTKMIEIAAVKGGRAYAVSANDALYEYTPSIVVNHQFIPQHWTQLTNANTVKAIDAVTDAQGNDAVFAQMTNGKLDEEYLGSWKDIAGAQNRVLSPTQLAHENFSARSLSNSHFTGNLGNVFGLSTSFFQNDISAGLDQQGNADVFGRSMFNDQLWSYTQAGGWTTLGTPGLTKQISATNAGQVAFIDGSTKLQKFDAQGTQHMLDSVSSFNEISAAAANDVFVVAWNKSLWERTAANSWHQISGPNTAL